MTKLIKVNNLIKKHSTANKLPSSMFQHHLNLALFDIKLKTANKNLLLIKGNEHEIESLPFEGSVKLSLNEDIHIKRLLCH